jgi:hypothetical protein
MKFPPTNKPKRKQKPQQQKRRPNRKSKTRTKIQKILNARPKKEMGMDTKGKQMVDEINRRFNEELSQEL